MSIKDEAMAAQLKGGPPCMISTIRQAMSKKEAAELDEALADMSITGTAIARVLQRRGLKVTHHSIQRHRRKDCTCV